MENNEEGEETAPRNEWEVVSLTQSAYSAAPDSRQADLLDDSSAEFVAETSDPMIMSGHFGFPPNQPENVALLPDNDEILNEQGNEEATPESVADKGINSGTHEVSSKTKGLSATEFPGDQMFDEKVSILSLSGVEFEEDAVLQGSSMVDKEQIFFSSTTYSSFHSEEPIGVSASTEESDMLAEPVELVHEGIDSGVSNLPKAKDEDNNDAENLPCQAWWKRRAVSLIAHAKDANTFWSIFFAAAVMGLVVIGQSWRLERWQVLQMKWQFGGHDAVLCHSFQMIVVHEIAAHTYNKTPYLLFHLFLSSYVVHLFFYCVNLLLLRDFILQYRYDVGNVEIFILLSLEAVNICVPRICVGYVFYFVDLLT